MNPPTISPGCDLGWRPDTARYWCYTHHGYADKGCLAYKDTVIRSLTEQKTQLWNRLRDGHYNSHPEHFIEHYPVATVGCASCDVLIRTAEP